VRLLGRSLQKRLGAGRAGAGDFRGKWAELIATKPGSKVPIDADATFKIDNLPLSDLGDGQSMGAISGYGGISGLGKTPEFAVNLDVQGLRVGNGFNYDRGNITSAIRFRGDSRRVGVDRQLAHQGVRFAGRLDAEVHSSGPVKFSGGWIPGLDEGQELRVSVTPSLFRLSTLLPLVEPALANLEGDLNGFVKAPMCTAAIDRVWTRLTLSWSTARS